MTQWAAHKCVITGKLISMTAAIKKERKKTLSDLFSKLKLLEASHKKNLAQRTHLDLIETAHTNTGRAGT